MASVTVCNRCGVRLDGTLDRQAHRHVAVLEVTAIGHPQRYEVDLCDEHAAEVVAEFQRAPFMESIEPDAKNGRKTR